MQKKAFSYTRRIITMMLIAMVATNSLMADVLPIPTRKRPKPIPMKADPASQQPVRPYIQRQEPQEPEPMIATMYGTLIPLGKNATLDATYALCRKVDEQFVPVCFIKWEGRGLGMFENKEVKATGFLKEKKGWTCPLLVVEYQENVEFLHQKDMPTPPEPVFAPVEPQPAKPLPPPPVAKPLPPPQTQTLPPKQPLPPPRPAKPLPPIREENRIMTPSNIDYKPMPPKAVNPLRVTP